MDEVPDGPDDEATRTDLSVTRPESAGPATDRVRIVGAEPAGEATTELPIVSREEPDDAVPPDGPTPLPGADAAPGVSGVRLTDQPADPEPTAHPVEPVAPGQTAIPTGTAPPTELPHWTEPPTGQVPAVLARDAGDTGSGIVAPTWREDDSDWVAHDEEFEPAMFGEDSAALGSLDETGSTDADRRPWEFDLDAPRTAHPLDDPITEPVARVVASSSEPFDGPGESLFDDRAPGSGPARPSGIPAAVSSATRSSEPADRVDDPATAVVGAVTDDEDDLFAMDKARPTGSTRVGRARRNGLRPARMRAKRPDEADALVDTPLAAEPPGASVTDVPGAGRKRGGVAGLAAADRTTERESEGSASETDGPSGADGAAARGAAVGVAGFRGRLSRNGATEVAPRTSDGSEATGDDGSTGGGPPAPRRQRRPDPARTDGAAGAGSSTGLRVGTGIAVAVVALLAFKLGTVPALVLSLVVVTFAAGECFGVLRRAGYHPATLLGLVGTISLMVGAYNKGVAALPLVLVLITVFTLIWYLFGIERGSPVAGTAATLLTVGWVSLLGAFAGLLLSPSAFPDRHGIAFLLGAIIATVANDVGALVIGGWLGSRPLAPNISPNKTWEGLFGGAVFSILASTIVVGAIHPWTPANAALLGVVVAVVAPVGDLCESLLKRDLRLKDMGTLLPGHGGVLDRVDALLFVLPATYYLVRALNIA